ncbi:peptidase, M16 family [Teladorsagia circumcincta]|uniref:Peptidase, M16 family n=1 Tax=Teladorsagia circumcincta TaxID=45464 RepID=A0A2G9UJX0_TELCI|nr:peptidase, M16 family [Teladorsagia circumcincta]
MAMENIVSRRHDNIIKSQSDQMEYRGLELTNGLRVLLISDPTTDTAAAAMDVNVGSLMDPWEIQGLAHFCEHMLFLGTEKYPLENEFYKEALDRFAQFFITPKFAETATEREVQTIESELSKYLNDDTWRLMQVMRMSLCIVGAESLDVMESLLKASDFGTIEDKGVNRKEWLESPYGKEQLGKRVEWMSGFEVTLSCPSAVNSGHLLPSLSLNVLL